LEELVVVLYAVQAGLTDSVPPSGVGQLLQKGLDWLRQHNPQVCGAFGGVVQGFFWGPTAQPLGGWVHVGRSVALW
jgi:hypothetical protein